MKLTVFQSDKGDCLLITSADGKNILADGGMRSSYKKHVAPAMNDLLQRNEALDLVYVSHIDQDHIAGVLRLMDDVLNWRVHDFQTNNGNPGHPKPASPRPPQVKKIWHNSFHEQVAKNSGPIEEMLAANAALLSTRNAKWAAPLAIQCAELATSKTEAARLSRRIGDHQLGIPLNPEFEGKLMMVQDGGQLVRIGQLSISIIGPFREDLETLRKRWNKWLKSQKGREAIRKIRKDARGDEARLGWNEIDLIIGPIELAAREMGDRGSVTPPNLASLMLLVEEDGKKVLMTGDGHWDDILRGLDACGKLDGNGNVHVDILKVQHHGSEHNTSEEFARRVTANHYVFCGNGAHENPDHEVVQAYIDSRIGPTGARSPNPQVGDPFKLWFNSKSNVTKPNFRDHMRELEQRVEAAKNGSGGKMDVEFLEDTQFVLDV